MQGTDFYLGRIKFLYVERPYITDIKNNVYNGVMHTENSISNMAKSNQISIVNSTLLIDLAPNGIPFDAETIGKV